jgi:DNA-binding XRE family transcriptional regulator
VLVIGAQSAADYDENMARQPFAKHLREAREATGISQFALARLAGFSQQQISAIETGDRDVSWDEAVSLIEACGGKVTIQRPSARASAAQAGQRATR